MTHPQASLKLGTARAVVLVCVCAICMHAGPGILCITCGLCKDPPPPRLDEHRAMHRAMHRTMHRAMHRAMLHTPCEMQFDCAAVPHMHAPSDLGMA